MMLETVEHHEIDHAAGAGSAVQHVLHRDYETRSRAVLKMSEHIAMLLIPPPRSCVRPTRSMTSRCSSGARRSGPPEFIEAANNPFWVVAAHNDAF